MNTKQHSNNFWTILTAMLILAISIACLYVSNIWLSWVIVTIGILYGIRLIWKFGRIWWEKRHSKVAQRERSLILLVSLMMFFLATGTALFLWAFSCLHDDNISTKEPFLFINAEYLLRSLVCSLQLFTASIDSNVLDGIAGHQYIKGLISVQAVLSFCCTIAIILSLAFARVKAYYQLHRRTKITPSNNHLYVFFGMNNPSRLLAKSIHSKDAKAQIIFVENNHVDEEEHGGWENIVGLFAHRRQTFAEADELGAKVTFTETRLCDINKADLENENADILTEINLRKLRSLICDLINIKEDAQLHIFFLSENEDENIRAMSTLSLDSTIEAIKNEKITQRFYCHARQNGLNRVVEDIAIKRDLEVRIVDSSHLAIELLKAEGSNHPVRFVDLDKNNPTTVISKFNALVVGFDEVGQDALKFLYEFGAFVDHTASEGQVRRSPFHCVVTDKRMEELEGAFTTFMPAAMNQENADGSKLIELRKCDCLSGKFFETIVDINLNYIVIAVGNDELGMTMAIRLLNYIRKGREDLRKLHIYVRSYSPDKEAYMQKIAKHYNDGYNLGSKDEYKTDAIIIPFGQMENIYSYEMIVNEELIRRGRTFQEGYARIKGEKELWNNRRKKAQEKGTLDSLRSLSRKESQDLANALHVGTKMYLLQEVMEDNYNWEDFLRRYFDNNQKPQKEGGYEKINYPFLSNYENKVILNLARLEHLRWNASHEMLGYTKANENLHGCDERTRQHNCLRPWEELDTESRDASSPDWEADYKSFDFSVVDISILLNKEKLLAQ